MPPNPTNPWTVDDVQRLRGLHEAGLSQRQIAERLGRTHDSVSRKMRALRLRRTSFTVPRADDGHFVAQKPALNRGPVTLPPLASLQDE